MESDIKRKKEYEKALEIVELEQAKRKKGYEKELKMCNEKYRGELKWAGITTEKQWLKLRERMHGEYKNGQFFFETIGMQRNFDPDFLAVLINLRQVWIKDYDIKTAPEFMLLDSALIAYYHQIKLHSMVGNMEAKVERQFFTQEELDYSYPKKGNTTYDFSKPNIAIENIIDSTINKTIPLLDKFNRMFLRNLKALRDLKRSNINLNIGNVGQINVGKEQVNIQKED